MAEPISLCGNISGALFVEGHACTRPIAISIPALATNELSPMVIGSPRPGVTRLSPFRHCFLGECQIRRTACPNGLGPLGYARALARFQKAAALENADAAHSWAVFLDS